VLGDPQLAPFFEKTDMARLEGAPICISESGDGRPAQLLDEIVAALTQQIQKKIADLRRFVFRKRKGPRYVSLDLPDQDFVWRGPRSASAIALSLKV
jgi:hypothetical protein